MNRDVEYVRCVDDMDGSRQCPGLKKGKVYEVVDVGPRGRVTIRIGGKSRSYLESRFSPVFRLTEGVGH